MDNNGLQEPGESQSPKALASVIQAFQEAGHARRHNRLGSDGITSDRERERRIDKERKDRVKEKIRQASRKGTGDIDGRYLLTSLHAAGCQLTRDAAVLNDVNVEWEGVQSEDVSQVFASVGSREFIIT